MVFMVPEGQSWCYKFRSSEMLDRYTTRVMGTLDGLLPHLKGAAAYFCHDKCFHLELEIFMGELCF